jgi:hypothetical protein
LRSNFYASPGALPPLEIHFSGQHGPSLLSNQNGYALTLAAGCRECMASAPQDDSGKEGSATQFNSAATSHALKDNLANIGSESLSMANKGKKRRHSSSGGAQGNPLNARGPKVAGVIRRAKGKQAQKACLWDANPSPPEEKSDTFSQEGRDLKVKPRMFMFTRDPVKHFADGICCSLQAQTMI